MATTPYLRSSLARSLYVKMIRDDNLRTLDKSKWYNVSLDLVGCGVMQEAFFQSCVDSETEDFLENCFDKSDWLFTQIFHAFARSVMCWFMSRTSINGFLGRGSMFVFSSPQFESIVGSYPQLRDGWTSHGSLLDLGAGDGKVTDVMARHFRHTYVTEISGVMGRILSSKNYRLLDVDKWWKEGGPRHFDLISCLNLLDRCDRPITLLQQIRSKLDPDNGLLLLAVVLPLKQYVESGSKYHSPSETIAVRGKTFEEQVSSLTETLFSAVGFRVERWTRLPYLCEGDLDQAFYWLNDALFVLKVAEPCTAS